LSDIGSRAMAAGTNAVTGSMELPTPLRCSILLTLEEFVARRPLLKTAVDEQYCSVRFLACAIACLRGNRIAQPSIAGGLTSRWL
jgi:hypothetical protein